MNKTKTCTWIGKSGKKYKYFVYKLPYSFKEKQDGNYIYAKLVEKKWRPIYIGQGDLHDRVSDSHHRALCIKTRKTTHVHAHLNPKEQNRISEETDLLQKHTQAYEPTGCNKKPKGK